MPYIRGMNTREAYNQWAAQYDTNDNKTRDLEAMALRETLAGISFDACLEIGCGTGKNTVWLKEKAKHITAIDLSEEMLAKAKEKINDSRVVFTQADIEQEWALGSNTYDLVVFSLVLEHIEHPGPIFRKASAALKPGGHVYVGELHPFKQYSGSKARFDTEHGLQVVTCFNHHISDFTQSATANGLLITAINEYFDEGDHNTLPRILSLLFTKA